MTSPARTTAVDWHATATNAPVLGIVAGLDLSLTSTGCAKVSSDGQTVLARIQPGKRKGHDRLAHIREHVARWCAGADVVVVEGPSFGSTTGMQHERGGLWWMITHDLWEARIPYAVVPPASLKKYATGAGGGPKSGKDQVLAAVIRRYPAVPVDGNDVADALVLAAMGADQYRMPYAKVPLVNQLALAKIDWPGLPALSKTA